MQATKQSYSIFYRGKTQSIHYGEQYPTTTMNPQKFLKEITGEITQTTMGKENDSQSVHEGEKDIAKQIVAMTTHDQL